MDRDGSGGHNRRGDLNADDIGDVVDVSVGVDEAMAASPSKQQRYSDVLVQGMDGVW